VVSVAKAKQFLYQRTRTKPEPTGNENEGMGSGLDTGISGRLANKEAATKRRIHLLN